MLPTMSQQAQGKIHPRSESRMEREKTIDSLLQEIAQIDGQDDEFAKEAEMGTGNGRSWRRTREKRC